MKDRSGDDDWVNETLARAMLDGEPSTVDRPDGHEPGIGTASPRTEPSPDSDGPSATPDTGATASGDDDDAGNSVVRSIVEWVVVIVGALAMALLLRALLFQAFWIPSESMEPTLQRDDRVLVNRLSYRLHDVNRGDVIVFARPPGEPPGDIHDLIKRVIALEGETVQGRDGQIIIDDHLLIEDYIAQGAPIPDFGPIVVPEDHVFVMGDNRNNSRDSRAFSAIHEDSIVGRAFVLFWPPDRLRLL